jgi:hypothetical protein
MTPELSPLYGGKKQTQSRHQRRSARASVKLAQAACRNESDDTVGI